MANTMSNTARHNSGKSTVKKEIFRSSTLFSLIIVALFGLFLSINLYLSELSKAYSVINRTNHGVVLFVEGYFTEIINTISVLADNREIREALVLEKDAHRRILELFESFSKANKNISYIYSGYENGLMLINDWTAPDGFDPPARPWYQAAMETKPGTSIGLPYQEIKTGEWLISTSRALKGLDGKYRGVVAVDCSIDQIAGLLRRYYEYDTTYSYVVGKDGEIILHHDNSLLGESFPEITKAIQESSHGDFTYRLGAVKKLAHYKTVPSTGWTVVTAVERNEIIFPIIWRVLGLIGVTGLIAVILGFVQSVIMDKRISRPVVELSRKVKAVIAGEDYRDDDYTYPDNEIGFMAQEVGRLAASELYKKTVELRESEEQFKALFLESPVSIFIHDKDTGEIVDANKTACAAYGFSSLEQLQDNESWLDPPYFLEDRLGWIRKATIEGTQHFEWMNRKITGEIFWQHVSLRCVTVKGVERVLATGVDITKRKQAEEKIHQMAYYDSLTGLPNRELFFDRLGIALAHARRKQQRVAAAMLDVDNFKDVNDTLGHDVADLVLKAVAERLSAVLRESDTVARFGGDEFVLVIPDLKEVDDVIPVVRKIVESFREPFLIGAQQLFVTTSIGIAVYPEDGLQENNLLKNADSAMYQAKQKGRNRYQSHNKG